VITVLNPRAIPNPTQYPTLPLGSKGCVSA